MLSIIVLLNVVVDPCFQSVTVLLNVAIVMEKTVREGSVANSIELSQTGRQSAHSNRGSQWSLNDPAAIVTAPPIAEEGSIRSGLEDVKEVNTEGKCHHFNNTLFILHR